MSQKTSLQSHITAKIKNQLPLQYLEVVNESYMHSVPPGSESHFKLVVVSDEFIGMRLIARHRLINQILAEELADSIHALAIHTYTIDEWHEKSSAPKSPKCLGGSKFDS